MADHLDFEAFCVGQYQRVGRVDLSRSAIAQP
jgi:hypothetical protein